MTELRIMRGVIVALAMLLAVMVASPAFAQSGVNLQKDAGDNVENGQVVGDDSGDCPQEFILENGLCEAGAPLIGDPRSTTDPDPHPNSVTFSARTLTSHGGPQTGVRPPTCLTCP